MRLESIVWVLLGMLLVVAVVQPFWQQQVADYDLDVEDNDTFSNYQVDEKEIEDIGGAIKGDIYGNSSATAPEDRYTTGILKGITNMWKSFDLVGDITKQATIDTGVSETFGFYFIMFLGISATFGVIYLFFRIRSW